MNRKEKIILLGINENIKIYKAKHQLLKSKIICTRSLLDSLIEENSCVLSKLDRLKNDKKNLKNKEA